jgi:hypothetical protein
LKESSPAPPWLREEERATPSRSRYFYFQFLSLFVSPFLFLFVQA